jgi:hypothetical protein
MNDQTKRTDRAAPQAVTAAALAAAAEIGTMRRQGEEICDVAHIEGAMRAATTEKRSD